MVLLYIILGIFFSIMIYFLFNAIKYREVNDHYREQKAREELENPYTDDNEYPADWDWEIMHFRSPKPL